MQFLHFMCCCETFLLRGSEFTAFVSDTILAFGKKVKNGKTNYSPGGILSGTFSEITLGGYFYPKMKTTFYPAVEWRSKKKKMNYLPDGILSRTISALIQALEAEYRIICQIESYSALYVNIRIEQNKYHMQES